MSEFLDFVFTLMIFAFIMQIIIWMIAAWKSLNKELELNLFKKISEKIHSVTVEEHNGQEYWFDQETGIFLSQGKTLNDIIESLKLRFAEHIFFVNEFGLSKHTDWKLIPKEEFKNIKVEMNVDI